MTSPDDAPALERPDSGGATGDRLAASLGRAAAAAEKFAASVDKGTDEGLTALHALDEALAQATSGAESAGQPGILRGIAACRETVAEVLGAAPPRLTPEVVSLVCGWCAALPHAWEKMSRKAQPRRARPAEPGPAAVSDSQTADAWPLVALTAEEFDSVHQDEDQELVGFFLDMIHAWTIELRRLLGEVGRADGRTAYAEVVRQLAASANYVDIRWVRELAEEQRATLEKLDATQEADRESLVKALAEGVVRLTLLLEPRQAALTGTRLSRVSAGDSGRKPTAGVAAPAEVAALGDLARTLADLATRAERAQQYERPALERRINYVLAQIASVTGKPAGSQNA